MSPEIKEMKHQFAIQLKKCLENQYGGRIPSISTIARDFSLKANHLPHVSGETVRKWLRAETIPQYPRVQSLSDWLGPELLIPFENWTHRSPPTSTENNVHITNEEVTRCTHLLQKLTRDDFNLILKLIGKLHYKKT
jgi:hypothetical protein